MRTPRPTLIPIVMMLLMLAIGCDENGDRRVADMAERHLQRQAEQARQMNALHREVAEGARRLVEADAQAREEMVALQREVQAERAEVGQQRDLLEGERRDLAAKRHLAPIIAAAITNVGLLLACLLPLVLCWYLLERRVEPADDQVVAEVLLDFGAGQAQPVLLVFAVRGQHQRRHEAQLVFGGGLAELVPVDPQRRPRVSLEGLGQ